MPSLRKRKNTRQRSGKLENLPRKKPVAKRNSSGLKNVKESKKNSFMNSVRKKPKSRSSRSQSNKVVLPLLKAVAESDDFHSNNTRGVNSNAPIYSLRRLKSDGVNSNHKNANIANKKQTVIHISKELSTSSDQFAKKEEVDESIDISKSSSPAQHTNIVVKNRRNPPYCKICSKIFTSYKILAKHKAEHTGEKPYKCLHCEQNYATLVELTAHLRLHQGKLPYECTKCHLGFKTMKDYKSHGQLHVLRKSTVVEKQYECEFCCKKCKKVSDLERHTRVHTGEKPAVCNICNKRFYQTHNLTKHLLIHIQAKPFECEVCGKAFRRSDVLRRHFLTHSLVKPYHCPVCNKGFIRLSQLNTHQLKVHDTHC